jgi:hypothetical protein
MLHSANTPHIYAKGQGTSASRLTRTSQHGVPCLFIFSGLRTERGHPIGLESVTDPSRRHFDTHNHRMLKAGVIRPRTVVGKENALP